MNLVSEPEHVWAWRASVLFLVLAGATGLLFRIELAYGGVLGLNLVNVRHAHSHLMFFGWAAPALMLCIDAHLSRLRPPFESALRLGPIVSWLFALAVLAYVFFFLRGYEPFEFGSRRWPLSVIVSGLHVLGWYGFVYYYYRRRRGLGNEPALLIWDTALALLTLATVGAWGLALHGPLGLHAPVWMIGLTQFFLDTFSEGWLVLGVLGLAYAESGVDNRLARAALWVYAGSIPFVYALTMPADLVPPALKVLAGGAAFVAGLALIVHAWNLRRLVVDHPSLWAIPLILLALKGGGQALVGMLPDTWWPEIRGLRVLYIHTMLLGFVSVGLAAFGRSAGYVVGRGPVMAFGVASLVLLLGILPLTGFWPVVWIGEWTLMMAAWVSALPPLVALLLLGERATKRRSRMFRSTNS